MSSPCRMAKRTSTSAMTDCKTVNIRACRPLSTASPLRIMSCPLLRRHPAAVFDSLQQLPAKMWRDGDSSSGARPCLSCLRTHCLCSEKICTLGCSCCLAWISHACSKHYRPFFL
eukprot:6194884-Pleurochrysis_carterae.AAC.2